MSFSVVLPANLKEWLELEKELVALHEINQDEYLETVRAYYLASLHFGMAWVLDSATWILPPEECEYWGLEQGTKVMNHPYCWDFINNEVDNGLWKGKLFLASRGFIKTTTVKAIMLQDIAKDPETCWLFVSSNKTLAIDRIARTLKEVKSNELLKAICRCPWDDSKSIYYDNPENERGSTFQKDRFNCRRKSTRDEYTLRAMGLEKRLNTGDHYKRQAHDDCEVAEGVTTLAMRNHMEKQFESLLSIRDNYDFQRMTWGTVHHYDGLHSRLRRKGIFTSEYVQPSEDVTLPPPAGFETVLDGAPVFLGPTLLASQRKEKGNDYYPQMMLDPRGKPQGKFMESYLRFFIRNPWQEAKLKSMRLYISCDGSKGTAKGDPQALSVFGHSYEDLWYLLDAKLQRLDQDLWTDLIVDTAIMWNRCSGADLQFVCVDAGGQGTDGLWVRKKLAKRGFYIPVREIDCKLPKKDTVDKNGASIPGKIETFVLSKLRNRQWVFPSDLKVASSEWKGKRDFVREYLWGEEMKNFGFTNSDHTLDTMSGPFLPYRDDKGKIVVPDYKPPNKQSGNIRHAGSSRGSWMSL